MSAQQFIKVQALIAAPVSTVWEKWTQAYQAN
jgi:hypothetical protein